MGNHLETSQKVVRLAVEHLKGSKNPRLAGLSFGMPEFRGSPELKNLPEPAKSIALKVLETPGTLMFLAGKAADEQLADGINEYHTASIDDRRKLLKTLEERIIQKDPIKSGFPVNEKECPVRDFLLEVAGSGSCSQEERSKAVEILGKLLEEQTKI